MSSVDSCLALHKKKNAVTSDNVYICVVVQIVACEHVQYFLNMDDTLQTASDMKQSVRTTSKQPPNIVERCVDHSCIEQ